MTIKEIGTKVDDYLDGFLASNHSLIKIDDAEYPLDALKTAFLERIAERQIQDVAAYIFLKKLYLERV